MAGIDEETKILPFFGGRGLCYCYVFLFSFFLVAVLLSDTAKKKLEHLDAKLVLGSQFSSLEHKIGYQSLVQVLGGGDYQDE